MGTAVRPCIAVAATAVAGGLIAAAPSVTPSLPDVQIPEIQHTALAELQDAQLQAFSDLIHHELTSNHDLSQSGLGLENLLPGNGLSGFTGFISQLLNMDNTLAEDGQNALNSLIGEGFNGGDVAALDPGGPFDGGVTAQPAGGVAAGPDQGAGAAGDGVGITLSNALSELATAEQAFDSTLISAELNYNSTLVAQEVAATQQVLGSDSAVADVVGRLFNISNALLYYQENALNNVLGAGSDANTDAIQGSLTSGAGPDGFVGVPGQLLGAVHDLAGFDKADWSALAGITPEQWNDLLVAADPTEFFSNVLPGLDWSSLVLPLAAF